MFKTETPAGGDNFALMLTQVWDNDKLNRALNDAAVLITGLTRGEIVAWSTANSRWELYDGTVAPEATTIIGIVEYVGSPDTSGGVRVTGVYLDDTLTDNTAYYCQSDGTLGTTETATFIGVCTDAGRLVMQGRGSGSGTGGANYFGSGIDGAKTFATSTYLGHAAIDKYAVASNVVTITTKDNHGFTSGDLVSIQQSTLSAINNTAPSVIGGISAGTHFYSITVTGVKTFTFAKTTSNVSETSEVNADATCCKWDGPAIVKHYTNLTINSGVTVTPAARCKGLLIYATGNVDIAGTLTMTARGAYAAGVESGLYLITPTPVYPSIPNFPIPAAGANGGAAAVTTGGAVAGNAGITGTDGKTGGGGSGAVYIGSGAYTSTGLGAAGTSYSGGAGGGGSNNGTNRGFPGTANGGPGGDSSSSGGAAGAGNPSGGQAYGSGAQNGTGGLLVLICKGDLNVTGTVSANGCAGGGETTSGGGGSGGGSVNLFYGGSFTNLGTIQASGGAGGTGSVANGGAGGAGSTRAVKISA